MVDCQIPRGDFFFLSRVLSFLPFYFCFMDLKLAPFLLVFLSACRMTGCHEEVSTNQVGRRRGIPRETLTTNSLIVAMFVEELRLYI